MNGEFSYPVLSDSRNDYLNSSFKAELTVSKSQNEIGIIEVNANFSLDEPVLTQLVAESKAKLILHIEGKNSSYRKVFQTTGNSYSIQGKIDTSFAGDSLEINALLIANTDIPELSSDRFNPDFYENFTILNIQKGQILAFTTTYNLKLDFKNNEKHEGTPPMVFRATDNPSYSINLDSEDIIVELPKKSFQIYKELSNSTPALRNMFLLTFVVPALSEAISLLQNENGEDNPWEDTIRYKLDNLGIKDSDFAAIPSLELAQLIIGNPLDEILVQYKNYYDRGEYE